jgi:hypothetical protein
VRAQGPFYKLLLWFITTRELEALHGVCGHRV